MLSPRELLWDNAAVSEYIEFLKRRSDKAAVRACVEKHLLAVADDLTVAMKWDGPGDVYLYRFHCDDTDAGVHLQAVLEPIGADRLAILSCNTIAY